MDLISITLSILMTISPTCDCLEQVETNRKQYMVGDSGRAYGVLQIHSGVITDVNYYYNTKYIHTDAFNLIKSRDMCNKYLSLGVSFYISKHGKSPTSMDIIRMWNGGIYNGYNNPNTINYYLKYIKYEIKTYNPVFVIHF